MNKNRSRIFSAGLGGAVVVAGLALGATVAIAQDGDDGPQLDPPPASAGENTTINPWQDGEFPFGDGTAPWGDGEFPFGDGEFPFGDGTAPWGDGEFPFGDGGAGLGSAVEGLAGELGITVDELQAAIESGDSLAEIAEQAGTTLEELVAGRMEQAVADIDEKVESGELTQEQADAILKRIEAFANGDLAWSDFGGLGVDAGEFGFGRGSEALADALGLSADELEAAFEGGKTLPEIASDAGVDLSEAFGDRGAFMGGAFPFGRGAPPWLPQDASGN